MSQILAEALLEQRRRARELGLGLEFKVAWQKIWLSLNTRPLPPDESDQVFGEILYTTPHEPKHQVCIASVRPLTIYFSVYYGSTTSVTETNVVVNVIRAIPMF